MDHHELGRLLLPRLRGSGLPNWLIVWFVGVADTTVRDWMKGVVGDKPVKPPRGERLNRLWHLLAAAGVDSPEMNDLAPFNRYLSELLAYQVITLEEAQAICGGVGPQTVLETIRGTRTPAVQAFTADELCNMYGAELERKKEDLRERLARTREESTETPTEPAVDVAAIPLDGQDAHLVALATQLIVLVPALRHLVSESCTVEQREQLRKLVGGDNLQLLGVLINGLVSERVTATVRATLKTREGR